MVGINKKNDLQFFIRLIIIIFLFIALFLSIGFIVANFLASPSNPDPEKLSAYECGFEAFMTKNGI